jgi:hypothetical protein
MKFQDTREEISELIRIDRDGAHMLNSFQIGRLCELTERLDSWLSDYQKITKHLNLRIDEPSATLMANSTHDEKSIATWRRLLELNK